MRNLTTCAGCGVLKTPDNTSPSNIPKPARYCRACAYAKAIEREAAKPYPRICKDCGSSYDKWNNYTSGGSNTARCRACFNAFANKRRKPYVSVRVMHTCERDGCDVLTDRLKWCSETCARDTPERRAHNATQRGWRTKRCAWCDHEYRTRNPSRCCSLTCAAYLKRTGESTPIPWDNPGESTPIPWTECQCGIVYIKRGSKVHCLKPYVRPAKCSGASAICYSNCLECGSTFVRRADQAGQWCSVSCRKRATKRDRNHRIRSAQTTADRITIRQLGERDGWRCHLCGRTVTKRQGNERESPSVDHLIPVSQQGTHTWDNVALAHRICNSRRSDKGLAQLRLAV